jgi:hypothetical protein
MSVTAETLSKKACIGPEIKRYAQEIIGVINDKLNVFPCKYGLNTCTHDLPIKFDTLSLSLQDAQLAVYSLIIANFKKRGFNVELSFYRNNKGSTDKVEMHISWESKINLDQLREMEQVIKRCSTIYDYNGKKIE